MEDKIEKMSERLEALEHEYHSYKKIVKAGAAIFVVLLVIFFVMSLSQTKSHVNNAMGKTAIEEAVASAHNAALEAKDNLQIIIGIKNHAYKYTKKIEKFKIVPIYQFSSENNLALRYFYSPDKSGPKTFGWNLDNDKKPVFNAITIEE